MPTRVRRRVGAVEALEPDTASHRSRRARPSESNVARAPLVRGRWKLVRHRDRASRQRRKNAAAADDLLHAAIDGRVVVERARPVYTDMRRPLPFASRGRAPRAGEATHLGAERGTRLTALKCEIERPFERAPRRVLLRQLPRVPLPGRARLRPRLVVGHTQRPGGRVGRREARGEDGEVSVEPVIEHARPERCRM